MQEKLKVQDVLVVVNVKPYNGFNGSAAKEGRNQVAADRGVARWRTLSLCGSRCRWMLSTLSCYLLGLGNFTVQHPQPNLDLRRRQ